MPTRHENAVPANRRRTLTVLSTMRVVLSVSMLVVLSVFVVLATIVGPGMAIDWVGIYLIPVVMILGVAIAALALVVWALKRLPDPPYRDR